MIWLEADAIAPEAEAKPNPIPLAVEGYNSGTYTKKIEK